MDIKQVREDLIKINIKNFIENEPMYKHTTYKVGGPTRFFVYVESIDELIDLIQYIKKNGIQSMIIGNGSDLLFSDREYEGIIISLNKLKHFHVNGNKVYAEAGVGMIYLAYQCAKIGLSGFEFMGGIPGVIGGGLYMNAGAYQSSLSEVFVEAKILDENLNIRTLNKEEMEFGYRKTILQKKKDWIVLEATFELETKDPKEIKQILDNRKERRMMAQPWNQACAGSVFRNPSEKPAWQYIDEAGLRGYEIGGASVSMKHSNFIVNNGYASAKDILELIELVEKTVYKKFNIKLIKEVILVNWE